ncbi:phospholipase D/Transphosphatidylase [Thioalkalivibrio sulfidiphilus HL-EbGr7]|uniref:Cardiolipin synthase A n=1 Tax=Thioalkalivibrio sulfidiphilus (strain HL-EbGR7) TaxID=396588 RepID=B8GLN3_THISH|nr:cardiolipin synthase [Thioalkalivibrio sulfidiphilus]ACL73588.1 phospholipase D/Transphosphatidylase [Thioalkalivibrio sulfidiphilus HL-EbGr7]
MTADTSLAGKPSAHRRRRWRKWVAVLVIAHLVGFASSIDALMSTRTPQGAVAWIVSLNAVPYVAVPAYWVFGRDRFQGYMIARRDEDSALAMALAPKTAELWSHRHQPAQPDKHLYGVETLAKWPILGGNEVQLLVDGEATFESIFRGIDAAERYLLVQFYIVRADALGLELQRRLIERAQAGVEVYFLYDEIGSYRLPSSYLQGLEAAGVRVHRFHSTRGRGNRFQLNFRNHRKIVVADGVHAWVGGLNVGEEYLGRDPRIGPWRDTHLHIQGPAALALQSVFIEDWHWATEEIPDLLWEAVVRSHHGDPVLILPSGPADRFETASLMMQQAIHAAHHRIWIASPYFVPDEGVIGMLKLAALSGVDVRILIPERPDNLLTYYAAYAFVGPLLEAGVRIYRYQDGFLHGKAFVVDEVGGAVGTVNLDNRSFRLNFEVTALVMDPDFARELEAMFETDYARSREMRLAELHQLPLWHRIAARAAYLFAPVL